MAIKSFLALFVLWAHSPRTACTQNFAVLYGMKASERLAWVINFVDTELNQKDSVTAYASMLELQALARKWRSPDLETEVYAGRGRYKFYILHDSQAALREYKQGLDFAQKNDLDIAAAGLMVHIGNVYRQTDEIFLAYEAYTAAHDLFTQTDFAQIPRLDWYEYEIGRFLYDLEDWKGALEHLCLADLYPGSSRQLHYAVISLIGNCYHNLHQLEKSLVCHKKCFRLAQKDRNTAWESQSAVNIAEIYLQDSLYREARIYGSTGYRQSLQTHNLALAAQALICLSAVNIYEGNYQAAVEKLKEAENYLQADEAKNLLPALYLGLEKAYKGMNEARIAQYNHFLYDIVSGPIHDANVQRSHTNLLMRRDLRRNHIQTLIAQNSEKSDRTILIILITLGICMLVFGYSIYQRVHVRQTSSVSTWQAAENTPEKDFQTLLEKPVVRAKSIPDEGDPPTSAADVPMLVDKPAIIKTDGFEQLLALRLLTEEDSKSFKRSYEKVHPGFLTKLRTGYPHLTPSETRLLALTKINLSTKEISDILNIEPNSVRRLRNRIRQKLDLPAGDNFEKILS